MVVRFQVVAPATKRRTFTVRLPILLGRGDEAKFRIQHDLVSRRHCELFERGGEVYIRDLGSTNGTFLNDEQVPASTRTKVPSGGVVRVGGLSFAVEYQPSVTKDCAGADGQVRQEAGPGAEDAAVADDGVGAAESRVQAGGELHADQPDFRVDHADGGSMADVDGPPSVEAVGPPLEEAVMTDPEMESMPEAVAAPEAVIVSEAVSVPEAESWETADPDKPSDGFDFLAPDDPSASATDAPQWPGDTDEGQNDGSDDDELNAFFKGLK